MEALELARPAAAAEMSMDWWDDHPDRWELDPTRPAAHELAPEALR